MGDLSEAAFGRCEHDHRVADTVESNAQALQTLLEQVGELRECMASHLHPAATACESDHDETLRQENEQLHQRVRELEDHVFELERQNNDLASRLAGETVRETVSRPDAADETLSWEDRKKLILQQMEDESFDADAFVSSLQTERQVTATGADSSDPEAAGSLYSAQLDPTQLDPAEFVEQLHQQLEQNVGELRKRDDEIRELRELLSQRGESGGETVFGAAAIGEFIESDELIQQERQRLQQLQREWEEKFREGEIEASLERAKLSRERQELARKQAEVDEQLEHLRRECRQAQDTGANTSRRWLAKLGLTDTDRE